MMILENLDEIAQELETQELKAQAGVSSPQLYGKLLAIYIHQNDLCNAKFLWKRIPQNIKASNPELEQIWSVGRALWRKNAPEVYAGLSNTQWTDNVAPIMKSLIEIVRDRALNLVARAYSSLNVETFIHLIGLPSAEALSLAKEKGWKVEDNFITPVTPQPSTNSATSSEDQLHKLTDFVSFLEN